MLAPCLPLGRTWRALTHVLLDAPVGFLSFVMVATLVTITLSTAVVLPVAVIALGLLFVLARFAGHVERSRFAALLDIELVDAVDPLRPGSWWSRLVQVGTSGSLERDRLPRPASSPRRSGASRVRAVTGAIVTALGVALVLVPAVAEDGQAALVPIGLGAVFTLAGLVVLGPLAARVGARALGAPLPALRGVDGSLARQNAQRDPKRTASTASALILAWAWSPSSPSSPLPSRRPSTTAWPAHCRPTWS